MNLSPINPIAGAVAPTVPISVSASSQRAQFRNSTFPHAVRIFNEGTATVFIEFGGVGVTAAGSGGAMSMPIGAGSTEVFTTCGNYFAVIAAGSTGNVYLTLVDGI